MINMDSLDDFSPPDMSDARAHVSASYGSADDGFDYQENDAQRLQPVTTNSVTAAITSTAPPAVNSSVTSTASPQRQYHSQQSQPVSQQQQHLQQQQQQQAHAFPVVHSSNGAAVSSGSMQHPRPIMVSRCAVV
jgi:hypothetical protein